MKKPSLFERLTGSVAIHDYDDSFDDEPEFGGQRDRERDRDRDRDRMRSRSRMREEDFEDDFPIEETWVEEEEVEDETPQTGELPVDMYQTSDNIIIRALVAGVKPETLDISVTRDTVVISGQREEFQEAADDNYYHRELFWGGFTRTLILPEEVVNDESEASERHGLLEIKLPKLDKNRSTQLKVKSGSGK